ncbi:MAG: hypothetical protein ACI90V_009461 [Bacillariaceae sp.]|jgi:hypothetical protein
MASQLSLIATKDVISVILLLLSLSMIGVLGENDGCPMWLAPSYITETSADFPKYGLFAGQAYEQDSILPLSELAIPLIDFFGDFNRAKPHGSDVLEFLENYLWTQEKIGSMWEGSISAPGIIPGIGVLANYHSTYSNADFLQASILLRETTEDDEFKKPGEANLIRGSVTPYFNATLKATQHIPAGMEIFADFGDVWDGNFTENIYQDKIHRYDYNIADEIVNKMVDLYEKHPDLSLDMKEDIMDFMLQKVLTTVAGPNAKTINALIPDNPRKLKKVQEAGGTFMYRYRDMIRTNEWLEENGFCLDTIRQGVSTIPNAGRGAFAARDIKKGETITITPMVHIADKDLLTMYPIEFVENEKNDTIEEKYDESGGPLGKQILLNYAFGHPESSMVFVPTGPQVTLINNGAKYANAHVKWAESDDPIENPSGYLDLSVDDMAQVKESVLMMKVVAARDIGVGEEITINYGNSWQKAWDSYEKEWKLTKEGRPHPLKAEDLRIMYKNKPLETPETIDENSYPEDVLTFCFLFTTERPDGEQMTNQEFGTEINQFIGPTKYEAYDSKILYMVGVLDRKEAPGFFYNYTVRASLGENENEFADVVDVPHSACTFFDSHYSSDIHLEDAFRHPIGMPESLIPVSWRNLR